MTVTCTIEGDLAFVSMDDGKANAVNQFFTDAFLAALDKAESAKAVVLTGRTGFFCAGLDLKTIPYLPPQQQHAALDGFEHVTRRLAFFSKPIVAAVAGHALGAGACFALACDFVVSARGNFKIGLNEAAIGVPLPPFLFELGRLKLATPFYLRALAHGEVFGVDDGMRVGFIDALVENQEQLLSAAKARAELLAKIPHESYLSTKRLVRQNLIAMTELQIAKYVSPALQKIGSQTK